MQQKRSNSLFIQKQALSWVHGCAGNARGALQGRCINRKWLRWDRENYIYPKVTNTGSIIRHRIDYNGVGVVRDLRHIPQK